jgi:hypothetical protein
LNRVVYVANDGEFRKPGTTSSGETNSGETNRFFNRSSGWKNENGAVETAGSPTKAPHRVVEYLLAPRVASFHSLRMNFPPF